jgi:hypothetical protein
MSSLYVTRIALSINLRELKNSLVTRFIGPFSYENLSGQGTFSTPSFLGGVFRLRALERPHAEGFSTAGDTKSFPALVMLCALCVLSDETCLEHESDT